ncbi:hypothetical protein SKAU_G00360490 [Synaphobranchus kaupii]|uniref:Uncharacterized protein n=1 Tax=Synaphobranchus kaupii TaxID=118154 RepID=A0A9Q1EI83_SYNKA|nr:hypothetical protein SKAU_G00360490 [Synaphobranchus kaupii]
MRQTEDVAPGVRKLGRPTDWNAQLGTTGSSDRLTMAYKFYKLKLRHCSHGDPKLDSDWVEEAAEDPCGMLKSCKGTDGTYAVACTTSICPDHKQGHEEGPGQELQSEQDWQEFYRNCETFVSWDGGRDPHILPFKARKCAKYICCSTYKHFSTLASINQSREPNLWH